MAPLANVGSMPGTRGQLRGQMRGRVVLCARVVRGAAALAAAMALFCACGRREAASPGSDGAGLIDKLGAVEPEARLAAASELGIRRERAATGGLVALLADIRLDVRKAAAVALGRIGDPAATPALGAVLADAHADAELRRLAAQALGTIRDPRAVPPLDTAMRGDDEALANAAAHALAEIGEPAMDVLIAAVKFDSGVARQAAADALGYVSSDRAREALESLLRAAEPELRIAAAEGLVRGGHTNATPGIVMLLADPTDVVRRAVQRPIAGLGAAAAEPLCGILEMDGTTIEWRDAGGHVVSVPLPPVQERAASMLVAIPGTASVRSLLLAADHVPANQRDRLRARLLALLDTPDGRQDLNRLLKAAPSPRLRAMTALRDFLGQRLVVAGPKTDAAAALDAAGLGDVRQAIPDCVAALRDGAAELRLEAAMVLCLLGDARGRDTVLSAFRARIETIKAHRPADSGDGAPDVKRAAEERRCAAERAYARAADCLAALAFVADRDLTGALLPVLAMAGPGDNPAAWRNVQSMALLSFVRVPDVSHIDRILPFITHEGRPDIAGNSVEARACLALGATGDARAFSAIEEHLKRHLVDAYFQSKLAVMYRALVWCDRSRAYRSIGETLMRLESHRLPTQIDAVAALMVEFPAATAVPPMVYWINHDIDIHQKTIRDTLIELGRVDVSWLVEGFATGSVEARRSLAALIATGFDAEALARLDAAAGHPDPRVRQGLAWTFGCVGGAKAAAQVRGALGDPHHAVRSAAVWSAGRLGDPAFVEPVMAMLADGEGTVRELAAETLGRLGDRRAVPALVPLLGNRDPRVRACAVVALGDLAAGEALADVEALLSDNHPEVRRAAEYALNKMRGESK